MIETYSEPVVLGFLLDALEEEDNELGMPPIREEYSGVAFLLLKTALDALINSLVRFSLFVSCLYLHQGLPSLDDLTGLTMHRPDLSSMRRRDPQFHLHGFQ